MGKTIAGSLPGFRIKRKDAGEGDVRSGVPRYNELDQEAGARRLRLLWVIKDGKPVAMDGKLVSN